MNRDVNGAKEDKLRRLEEVFHEVARNISLKLFQGIEQGLTHPQYFMLKKMILNPVTVSEMADYMGVSLSAITSMADRLEKSGYIARKRTEEDRRLVWLEITGSGRKMLEETIAKRRETVNGFLVRLSEDDLDVLFSIYSKLLGFISEKSEKSKSQEEAI